MVSQWCAAPRGRLLPAPHAATCWPLISQDGPGLLWLMEQRLWDPQASDSTLKMQVPRDSRGQSARQGNAGTLLPHSAFGDTLHMRKHKQSKTNTIINKKRVREASSIHSPGAGGIVRLGECIFPLK